MASSAAIKSGEAVVIMGLDMGPLQEGLKQAQAKLQAFGKGVMAAGASTTALGVSIMSPFIAGLKIFADVGSDMLDMSDRTGIAVEALSELGYAAEQSGASAEILEKGFNAMAKILDGAAQGSQEAIGSLDRLGLSVNDLAGLSQDARFELIAQKISEIEDPSQRAAVAMDIFGKSGAKLLPLMKDGAEGIKAMRAEAVRLGVSMTTEDAQKAEAIGDQISSVAKQVKMFWFHLGAAIEPVAKQFLFIMQEAMAVVVNFVRENRELMMTIFKVGAAIAAAGVALTGIGALIWGAGAAFGVLASVVGIVGSVLAFVFSPFGLAVAGIALLGYGIYKLIETVPEVSSMFSGWITTFKDIGAQFMLAWGGITDAIAGGELKLAFQIAMTYLEIQWLKFKDFMLKVWEEATNSVAKMLGNAIGTALPSDKAVVSDAFQGMTKGESDRARAAARASVASGASANYDDALAAEINRRQMEAAAADPNLAGRQLAPVIVRGGQVVAGGQTAMAQTVSQAGTAEIQALEAGLEEMRMDAMIARIQADIQGGSGPKLPPGFEKKDLPKVTYSSLGTFSSSAIAGMFGGGGGPMDEVAKNTAMQLEVQERMLTALEGGFQWR